MEKLTAQMASELSKQNECKLETVLSSIEITAKQGNRCISMINHIPDAVILELMSLGFSISKTSDPFNEIVKIKW